MRRRERDFSLAAGIFVVDDDQLTDVTRTDKDYLPRMVSKV